MLYFLRLSRVVNLLVIVLTMYVLHVLFLWNWHLDINIQRILDPFFGLLVLSTILIAAAGNIINDYFDVKIDRVNKPEKVIVDRYVKKRSAILVHTLFNAIAVGIALIILFVKGSYWPLAFHFLTTGALWMYSGLLKRKFLIGNVVVGLLTAMVPLLVYLYDKSVSQGAYHIGHEQAFHAMAYFAVFAFFTTLIREIQKDFADMKGDALYGCTTVPIYLGIRKGRAILFAIFGITILLFIGLFVALAKPVTVNYLFFGVVLFLMLISLLQSYKAVKREAWTRAAFTMKLVMITALLFFAVKIYVWSIN